MDIGVERIVDQVVNPKLNSNFVPKIEEVAYKYLGIEKPIIRMSELEIVTDNHHQFLDLEQVSPESEKCPSVELQSPNAHNENMMNDDRVDDIDDKMDDLESPAFEPIECNIFKNKIVEQDDDRMDICLGDSDDDLNKSNGLIVSNSDEVKSNLSSISGLTSNDSIEDSCEAVNINEIVSTKDEVQTNSECVETTDTDEAVLIDGEKKSSSSLRQTSIPEAAIQQFDAIEQPDEKPSIHYSNDVVENLNQENSVLSQVSSNSRLSIITNNNTNTRLDDADDDDEKTRKSSTSCPYGISEEAQMQRFNESSSSNNSLVIDTDNVSDGTNKCDKRDELLTAFDINKEEIKFEGTERKSFDIGLNEANIVIDEEHPQNSEKTELNASEIKVPKTQDTMLASSTETSKDVNFKSEDLSSVSMADVSLKNESISNEAKLRIDDSKVLDETSSTSSKHKESKSSSSTSSSSHRNGIETDSKNKSKDRHSSSSSSRHRDHRSKRSQSSCHLPLNKDKTKNACDEHDGKHRDSGKHQTDDRTSKNHHKSSSSNTRTGLSRSSSSKNNKDIEKRSSSRSDKNENHRHSSSSLFKNVSRDKEVTSKHLSKHSDNKKSRSDSNRSSHREKDDHASCKEKPIPRKRSRSKDSNDGSTKPSNGLRNAFDPTNSTSTNQSTSATTQESGTDQQTTSEQQTTSRHLYPISTDKKSIETICSSFSLNTTATTTAATDAEENDFVLTTQPVVVDQILSGNELNLESFIDEHRDNPLIASIERTLADHAKVKKPKVAANFHEARKLMKLRKQIDREEQKKLEQARVLAKQYMRSNLTTIIDDSQGVELEFACSIGREASAPGPTISSPVKFTGGNEMMSDEKPIKSPTLPSTSTDQNGSNLGVNAADTEFQGFSEEVSDVANIILRQFETMLKKSSDQFIEMMSSKVQNRQLFLENNKITESESTAATIPLSSRKRKCTETSDELASVVANVLITPKEADPASGRPGLFMFKISPTYENIRNIKKIHCRCFNAGQAETEDTIF